MKTTLLILILGFITSAHAAPQQQPKSTLPFLTEGAYEAVKGNKEVCRDGKVSFNKEEKVLRVGAIYNFPVMNRVQVKKDAYTTGCKLSETYKIEQLKDHTRLFLVNRSFCPDGDMVTRTEVKIYSGRIVSRENINGRVVACEWKAEQLKKN